ncbi:uncharacterized protein [Halyomorpha halys]|uniref:uncharacterized protein isoform X2 n=1 Tax=Halyomorpha halys TaxID=286706 RepID=UPI0006D51145
MMWLLLFREKQPESIGGNESGQFTRNYYGSEPDLRFTVKNENLNNGKSPKIRISRTRKKYKAPQIPQDDRPSNVFFDDLEQNTRPSRRLRLFKTRMDLRRKVIQPSSHNSISPSNGLVRSLSSPQFQIDSCRPNEDKDMSASDEDEFVNMNKLSLKFSNQRERETHSFTKNGSIESFVENESKYRKQKIKNSPSFHSTLSIDGDIWVMNNKTVPVKTFYFGMDINENNCPFAIEAFASQIQHMSQSSSESQISSNDGFTDIIYDEINGGISVQLRATLPRKQIDIPRFSPTAAWRMLSTLDTVQSFQEDDVIPMENRILAPPLPVQIPTVMDKSADSGISGDASPQQHDSAAWTPQQDLEDTSSDGGFPLNSFPFENCLEGKYIPRFTVSLPKDDKKTRFPHHDKTDSYQPYSLQSIKSSKKTIYTFGKHLQNSIHLKESSFLDNNWMLSCNIPQSLNIMNSTQWNEENLQVYQDDNGLTLNKKPSYSYITSGGHIMYLPEYSSVKEDSQTLSKSCSELNKCVESEKHILTSMESSDDTSKTKTKKFTYQSTLKQNERKLLAETLSKQAEQTELKRRSELEVMQRVEEEFQRKREREKADIRQQLRLYSINNNVTSFESSQSQVLSELRQPLREYREFRKQR